MNDTISKRAAGLSRDLSLLERRFLRDPAGVLDAIQTYCSGVKSYAVIAVRLGIEADALLKILRAADICDSVGAVSPGVESGYVFNIVMLACFFSLQRRLNRVISLLPLPADLQR